MTPLARLAILALSTATLAGCSMFDSPMLKSCEEILKVRLRSPSTYQRIEVISHTKTGLTVEEWVAEHGTRKSQGVQQSDIDYGKIIAHLGESFTLNQLLISYDAANAFGTPVRTTALCTFPSVDGDDSGASTYNVQVDGLSASDWRMRGLLG